MTYLSVDEQDAEIRRLFPDFRLTAHADWIAVWEGPLRPASKTYRVRIVHFRRTIFEGWTLANDYVTVHVVDPLVGAEMLANETLLPHIYWNDRNPGLAGAVPLGSGRDVLDPGDVDRDDDHPVDVRSGCCSSNTGRSPANSWVQAGTRRGDARNVRNRPETSDPEIRARRERFRNAEFHRIGRRTGVFGSYLWMGAALRDYSQPLFSPSSSDATSAARLSPTISISSPAPRPEASSHSVSEPA